MSADYANLSGEIEDLKISAFDAYMCEVVHNSKNKYDFDIRGDSYLITYQKLIGPGDETGSLTISRPTKSEDKASGGGNIVSQEGRGDKIVEDLNRDFSVAFEEVCDRIERAMKSWRHLPDPDKISEVYTHIFKNISAMLAVPDGSVGPTGNSNIKTAFDLVPTPASVMSGTTWDAFCMKFYLKLPSAINGTNGLAHYLASIIQGESTMFEEARNNITSLVVNARTAFDSVATSWKREVNWENVIKVLAVVAEAATSVVTGVASGAARAAKTVVGGLKTLKQTMENAEEDKETKTGNDYDSVMKAFEESITSLGEKIRETERGMAKNLDDNRQAAIDEPGHYDLTLESITTGSSDQLAIKSREDVTKVIKSQMPTISDELKEAMSAVEQLAVAFGSVVGRPDDIGVGRSGPLASFTGLAQLVRRYLGELSDEAALAGKNLEAAVNDIDAHDQASAQKLKEAQKNVDDHKAKYD